MPTALAVSPHLDDAIFSAGGLLTRLSRNGWRVVVATVFTASVPDPQGFALACQLDKGLPADADYMALRRNEDTVACARIGAEPFWLPFAEAPHRNYRSAEQLFAGFRPDDTIVDKIVPALSQLVRDVAPDALLSPQAIGAHVDHMAVHLALGQHARPHWLWADFPYVTRPSARSSPFAEELRDFSEQRLALSLDEIETKINAASAYASQLGFQFGGLEAARVAIESAGMVERYVARTASAASMMEGVFSASS